MPRTPEQRAEVAAFVDWLYEKGNFDSWAAFSRQAEVPWGSLSDWHRGVNVPDGYNMLKLIRAALGEPPSGLEGLKVPQVQAVESILSTIDRLVDAARSSPRMEEALGPALQEAARAFRDLVRETAETVNILEGNRSVADNAP